MMSPAICRRLTYIGKYIIGCEAVFQAPRGEALSTLI